MKAKVMAYLAAGAVFCGIRWADLALWTDPETGLVTAGAVWQRYLVLAVFAAAALLVGRFAGGSPAPLNRRQPLAALPALAGAVLCLWQGIAGLLGAAGAAAAVESVLALACGAWLGYLGVGWLAAPRKNPPPAWFGVAGSLLFVWEILLSFMTNGSSWHRTIPTSAVWQQLAALLFLAALLRALCLPDAADGRALGGYGLLAFCLCLCWQLPRCVLWTAGPGDWALAAIGLLGGVCAVLCAAQHPHSKGSHTAG